MFSPKPSTLPPSPQGKYISSFDNYLFFELGNSSVCLLLSFLHPFLSVSRLFNHVNCNSLNIEDMSRLFNVVNCISLNQGDMKRPFMFNHVNCKKPKLRIYVEAVHVQPCKLQQPKSRRYAKVIHVQPCKLQQPKSKRNVKVIHGKPCKLQQPKSRRNVDCPWSTMKIATV